MMTPQQSNQQLAEELPPGGFKRKLSKREKKEKKKKEKEAKLREREEKENVAEKLYNELPETSFTRSISNPEAVMRRRRQQKLEKKLQQFKSKDGGPDTGKCLGQNTSQKIKMSINDKMISEGNYSILGHYYIYYM